LCLILREGISGETLSRLRGIPEKGGGKDLKKAENLVAFRLPMLDSSLSMRKMKITVRQTAAGMAADPAGRALLPRLRQVLFVCVGLSAGLSGIGCDVPSGASG